MCNELPEENREKDQGEASLARVMTRFMPYIHRRAMGVSADGLEYDDMVQEGLIGLFSAIESFDAGQGASFSTYAITCINNCMASAVRGAARKKHLPLNSCLSLSDEGSADIPAGSTPEEVAIAREGYAALKLAIQDDLSPFEREVLALYLEGYDYAALAARLDSTPKSIDNALQRARKKLKSRQ